MRSRCNVVQAGAGARYAGCNDRAILGRGPWTYIPQLCVRFVYEADAESLVLTHRITWDIVDGISCSCRIVFFFSFSFYVRLKGMFWFHAWNYFAQLPPMVNAMLSSCTRRNKQFTPRIPSCRKRLVYVYHASSCRLCRISPSIAACFKQAHRMLPPLLYRRHLCSC